MTAMFKGLKWWISLLDSSPDCNEINFKQLIKFHVPFCLSGYHQQYVAKIVSESVGSKDRKKHLKAYAEGCQMNFAIPRQALNKRTHLITREEAEW